MSVKILLNVEDVQVGNDRPNNGIRLEVWLYPITSDTSIRNVMDQNDYFLVSSDTGLPPMEYYDLIVSTAQEYMQANYSLTVFPTEFAVLGWNDLHFYGTSAYEDLDDLLGGRAASGEIGKFGWQFLTNGTGSVSKATSIQQHPGLVRLQTGTNGTTWSQLRFPTLIHSYPMDAMTYVFKLASAPVTPATYRIGLTPDATDSNAIGIWLEYPNSGTQWQFVANGRGGTSGLSTTVAVVGNWFQFDLERASRTINPTTGMLEGDWLMRVTNLTTGSTDEDLFSFDALFSDFAYPVFSVEQGDTNNRELIADWYSFRIRDLVRTLPEY